MVKIMKEVWGEYFVVEFEVELVFLFLFGDLCKKIFIKVKYVLLGFLLFVNESDDDDCLLGEYMKREE